MVEAYFGESERATKKQLTRNSKLAILGLVSLIGEGGKSHPCPDAAVRRGGRKEWGNCYGVAVTSLDFTLSPKGLTAVTT